MLLVTSLMGTQGVGSCPYAPNPEKEAQVDTTQSHLKTSPPLPTPSPVCYLPCCACHGQVAAVLAEENLLDAQPGIIAVGVEGAHLT